MRKIIVSAWVTLDSLFDADTIDLGVSALYYEPLKN